MNNLQLFQFTDKYARWNEAENRRETWQETVTRAVNYLRELSHNKLSNEDYAAIYEGMLNMEIAPSMRLLAMAGAPARRNNIALYNCAYLVLDSVDSFTELMVVLLEGAGCGYSVEAKYVNLLPIVKKLNGETIYHTIPDTSEGWYEAFRLLLNNLFKGVNVVFDYSQIRPAGSRLKTKGGTASGSAPLKRLFDFCKSTFKNAQGRKLTTLECHDIACHVGDAIVSGGVRRSALIALFDANDIDMLNCKNLDNDGWAKYGYRGRANNSVVIDGVKDYQWFVDYVNQMNESGAGEPGLFSRYSARETTPSRREYNDNCGMNPCKLYENLVLTPNGLRKVGELRIGDTIWSKEGWTTVINKMNNGVKSVYRYSTTAGYIDLTDNHPIVSKGQTIEVGKAKNIDVFTGKYEFVPNRERNLQAVMDGLVLGDGTIDNTYDDIYLCIGQDDQSYFNDEISSYIGDVTSRAGKNKTFQLYRVKTTLNHTIGYTYTRSVPTQYMEADYYTKADFLRGLYTANGSVVSKGERVTLKSASLKLIQDVQLMLNSLGIRTYYTTNKPTVVNFSNGEYECKQSYDLNITTDRLKFLELIGFIQPYKNEKIAINRSITDRAKSNYDIANVDYLGEQEVFDITVNNNSHTFWCQGFDIHNCGEILLRPFQFCNLSIVIARPDDTAVTLAHKVRLATIIGTIQSMATNFKGLRPIWRQNCEEERLLGVDITGQYDCPLLLGNDNALVFEQLKMLAIETNAKYAQLLEIPQSKSVTCVKPSGNSSVLFDCASGLHPRYAPYYIRRVRVQKSSPIANWLIDCGFELEQDVAQKDTLVASFPIKAPQSTHYKDSLTALEQLEYWLINKLYWTEHNPSVTISYRVNELNDMAEWLHKNQEYIGGLSFLPQSDFVYQQAPNEAIDEATYLKMLANTPELDLSKLVEIMDTTTIAQELACVSGNCDI